MSYEGMAVLCGCGRHMVDICDEKVVRYKERHWHLRCIFMKEERRLPKLLEIIDEKSKAYQKMKLKFIKMKKMLRSMPCTYCGNKAGNRFTTTNNTLICGNCSRS